LKLKGRLSSSKAEAPASFLSWPLLLSIRSSLAIFLKCLHQIAEPRIKTIRLTDLIPSSLGISTRVYFLWYSISYWGTILILKSVHNQTLFEESEAAAGDAVIGPSGLKWEHRHDLALQALLASLETAELIKVYQMQSANG
jgi:hypothetical protein